MFDSFIYFYVDEPLCSPSQGATLASVIITAITFTMQSCAGLIQTASTLLPQGAHRLLLKTTNIKMGVRLGLLNQDRSKALIFEVDSAKMKGLWLYWQLSGML